ncbi:phospholipase D family protein [Pectobacterium actinidiae]|uniref:Phospholipase D family protein n=1 Tax=Pectobacterium actinidiae TaxID=1507808 RepID=A0ABW8G5Z5_9GAMM
MTLQILTLTAALLVTAILAVRWRYPLPQLEPRQTSFRATDTRDTPLGRGSAAAASGHDATLSGVHLLSDGRSAFAARVLLAKAAVRTLDVQYYIWHNDLSGGLLLDALLEAANRGVRVRLLLDDNGIAGLDNTLAALDSHPDIEVRLFNPFVVRSPKWLGYATDFSRLNRRMHNKSFTADNQASIIGGRNIGDEYFDARDEGLFADLDVLSIGRVVNEVSADFDRYWASTSAYPASRILPPAPADALFRLVERGAARQHDTAAFRYLQAIRDLPFIEQMLHGALPFEWSLIRMVSDDPAKGSGKAPEDGLLTHALREALERPAREVRLISGYFVPTQAGVDRFVRLARAGKDVAIFTNAFEASDVWMVHAGYAHHRKALLRAGVRLFEMRNATADGQQPRRRLLAAGSGTGNGEGPVLRSSGATLHAKTFSIDRREVFVGSFNFDPRSMHLNTELGFLIRSELIAQRISDAFGSGIPRTAYEVVLSDEGELNWIEKGTDGSVHIKTNEPGTKCWQRVGIRTLSFLPIEWLL